LVSIQTIPVDSSKLKERNTTTTTTIIIIMYKLTKSKQLTGKRKIREM